MQPGAGKAFKLMIFWVFLVLLGCVYCKGIDTNNNVKSEDSMQNKLVETDEMVLHEDEKESRKSSKNTNINQPSLVERILPMMIIPFLISTAMVPLMLSSIKFMLIKSALVGKIGIILMLINLLRRRATGNGEVFSHNVNYRKEDDVAYEHYGYLGHEEYGNYVNRKRRKRKTR